MPMERGRYPKDWKEIALRVKEDAEWKCEFCGKQCRKPGEPFDTHRNTITVAHLDHIPEHMERENLKALCARVTLGMTQTNTQNQGKRKRGEDENISADRCGGLDRH